MEESSMDMVRDFEKLHVLASYDFQKMDELVQDLSLALEESSRSRQCARHDKHKTRKRRPRKRRPETTLLVPPWDLVNMSEASESSLDETLKGYMENVTRQSDSEENGGVPSVLVPSKSIALVESDSFTDNFTPRFSRRRRRKCKRMAVDPQPSPGAPDHDFLKPRHVRRTKGKSDAGDARSANRFTAHTAPGKRKRISNFPDKRTTECDDAEGAASKRDTPQRDGEAMDFSGEESQSDGCSSCSSLSSSESDLGVYTNDEGREADDEQSDYYHEAGSTCGIPDVKDWWELDQQVENGSADANFQKILNGVFPHMCKSSQQNFKCRLNRLNGLASREMRSGRRRLRDRRSLHTLPMWAATSDRICQVLMDPTQAEVRVRPGNKMERKYVAQYPTVYSLEATAECAMKKSGILIKSRHAGNQTDMKRLKRTPPSSPCAEESSNHAEASIVPEQDSSLEQSTESHCLHPTGARPRRRGSHDTPHAPTKDL